MSLPLEVAQELVKLADKWASEAREDLAHHALDVLAGEDDGNEAPCPVCKSTNVEDTGTFKAPRKTCKQCGRSWNPTEAKRG
jgi:peptide subunit release factor 1 (eRF1)